MPLPTPEFDEGQQWDGTTPRTRPDVEIFKRADGEIAGRHSSEILALEALLKDVVSQLEVLENLGAAGSVLTVTSDQTTVEWAAGGGGGAEFTATAGEALSKGDVVYMKGDGKVWKAKADADLTSVALGLSSSAVSADDPVNIILAGELTYSTWSFTPIGEQRWLSETSAGGIVDTPPAATGEYVVPIGIASDTDTLIVKILTRVKL